MMKWMLLCLLSVSSLWAAEGLQIANEITAGTMDSRLTQALKTVKSRTEPRVWIGFVFASDLDRNHIYIGSRWHREAKRSWRETLVGAGLLSEVQASDQHVILRVAFSPEGKALPESRVDFDWLKESQRTQEPLIWLGVLSSEESFIAIKALRDQGLSWRSQADLVEHLMHLDQEPVSNYLKRLVEDDQNVDVRRGALHALSQHNPARSEAFLQKQAQIAKDLRVQETAIEMLLMFDHEASVDVLRRIINGTKRQARNTAAEVLSHLQNPAATALLEKLVESHSSADVRERALFGLAERPGFWPLILAKAEEMKDRNLTSTAIHLMGEHYPNEASGYFKKWLDDPQRAPVYSEIIHAYAEANPNEACAYFEKQVRKHPHAEARMMMLHGMEDCGSTSFALLQTVFEKDPSHDVKSTALHRMAETFPTEAAAFYRDLIWNSQESDFQITAIHNLLEDLGGVSEQEMKKLLNEHPNPSVRAQVLDIIKDSGANFELLNKARQSEMDEVRFMAWEAMFESDWQRSFGILKDWLKGTPREDELHAAFHALMDDQRPEAVAFLMEIVENHKDSQVRATAVHYLADADQGEALLDLLAKLVVSDASMEVRSIAIHALGELPGKEGKRRLLKIARSETGEMQQEIIQYLSHHD